MALLVAEVRRLRSQSQALGMGTAVVLDDDGESVESWEASSARAVWLRRCREAPLKVAGMTCPIMRSTRSGPSGLRRRSVVLSVTWERTGVASMIWGIVERDLVRRPAATR